MHTVILRDDDTCALTPVACLERLYRPFLDRGMPVNLAVIPEVRTDVRTPDGRLEGFLAVARGPVTAIRQRDDASLAPSETRGRGASAAVVGQDAARAPHLQASSPLAPLAGNRGLVDYLNSEPGYHLAQHGCHHDTFEFGISDRAELARRLDHGARRLSEAGFARPATFVAPYDRISRAAYAEIAGRFDVISTGWFELGRMPFRWWPQYAVKKWRRRPHWRAGRTTLLSHPGCLLSFHRPYADMLGSVRRAVENRSVTVLVTHWWEYFRDDTPDEEFIGVLHEVAAWLASRSDVRVVSFRDVARGEISIAA